MPFPNGGKSRQVDYECYDRGKLVCTKFHNISINDYGCSDCIWFKKWGELHGYPDLWPFKYIKAGTYSDQLSLTEN